MNNKFSVFFDFFFSAFKVHFASSVTSGMAPNQQRRVAFYLIYLKGSTPETASLPASFSSCLNCIH